ncbi:MAG: response regulator, partial [Chitinispirillia bacterium]
MKKHILIIDDDRWLSELVKKFLSFEKFSVDPIFNFTSQDEIIEQISGKKYDCILIDYMLVCCNGIDLGKKLRKITDYSAIPFILQTTLPLTPQLSHELLTINMTYLKKPFKKAELINTIFEAMSVDYEDINH